MLEFQHTLRVLYPDTDQMGLVHHSNYARYYETARWEMFRSLNIPYTALEEAGYLLPVVAMSLKYHQPAFYDQLLTVYTHLKAIKGPRMILSYRIVNEQDQLVNQGETTLAFIYKETRKPCHPPEWLLTTMKNGKLI